jgi:hypothetical protein
VSPARTGVSRRVARAVLCTMLGDAVAAKPPLIPYNPAIRPRNRGRRTGRKLDRGPQRVWATPLQTLLVAERAALLSGPLDANDVCWVQPEQLSAATDTYLRPHPSRGHSFPPSATIRVATATSLPSPRELWLD